MDNRFKYLIKNTSILTIGSFSSKILVFLLVPLYTSILSTAEYGYYDLIATTIQMLMPVLAVSMYEGAMRFIMDKSKPNGQVVSIGFRFVLIGTVIFTALVLLNKVFRFWEFAADFWLYIIFYFAFGLLNQYANQLARGFEQVRTIAVAGVISTVIVVGCNILFLLVLKLGLKGFFLAYILSYIVTGLYVFNQLRITKYLEKVTNKGLQKEMLSYSAPLILNTIGWWANNSLDKYVVTWLCGVAVNGVFSVSYKIPSILNVLQSIFIQAWQISAIKETDSNDSAAFYGGILKMVNIMMSLCCMVLIALTIPIAKLLFAKDFFSAWQYAPFLLLSCVINAAGGVLGPVLSAKKNSKALGLAALYGALTNLVLNVALVYIMGVQGAAIATAISSFVIFQFRLKAVGKDGIYFSYFMLILPWLIMVVQSVFVIYTKLYFVQPVVILIYVFLIRKEIKKLALPLKNMIKGKK